MKIGNCGIGGSSPCFIVAEAGLAHEGSEELALRLVDLAVGAGADAVKFQVYKVHELVDRKRASDWFERFKSKQLGYASFMKIKVYAEGRGIVWFATPHTLGAFEFLKSLNVPVWKVGSGEKGNDLILRRCLDTGKPVFVSTGMREHSEVMQLIEWYGSELTAFLHCVSLYPTHPHLANLGFLRFMGKWCRRFGAQLGYSDHTTNSYACEIAAAMGAKVIEKHIKLPESTGNDVECALDRAEFKKMVRRIRMVESMTLESRRIYSGEERDTEAWALKGKDGRRPKSA